MTSPARLGSQAWSESIVMTDRWSPRLTGWRNRAYDVANSVDGLRTNLADDFRRRYPNCTPSTEHHALATQPPAVCSGLRVA